MKTKRFFGVLLLAATVSLPLAAQSSALFAPFVSRLELEQRNNFIRLSWVDSQDVQGAVHIYRSSTPFEGSVIRPELKIAQVPYGTQSFINEIDDASQSDLTMHYLIIASDVNGRLFNFPIEYINTGSIRIPAFAPVPTAAERPRTNPPPHVAEAPSGGSSLRVYAEGDSVIVSFVQGRGASDVMLYRSTRPIRRTQDLLQAIIVKTRIASPFIDSPVAGIPYYYAVVSEEDFLRGTVSIIPGRNATERAVELAAGGILPREHLRPIPLPLLSTEGRGEDAAFALAARSRDSLTQKSAGEVQRTVRSSPSSARNTGADLPYGAEPAFGPPQAPRVFARDLESTYHDRDDFALAWIVNGTFAAQNWDLARRDLLGFLSQNRNPLAVARARFYLGQTYYFMNRPREGLFEFFAIRDIFPAETIEWVRASFNLLAVQE